MEGSYKIVTIHDNKKISGKFCGKISHEEKYCDAYLKKESRKAQDRKFTDTWRITLFITHRDTPRHTETWMSLVDGCLGGTEHT